MRKPLENVKIFAERRARLAAKMQGSVLIVSSPVETLRVGSVYFSFKQDPNLYYLTGFEEPETVFIFRPGQTPESILFCRKKNPEKETWDGFRFGPEMAESLFKIDKAYSIEELPQILPGLMKGAENLYYRRFKNKATDAIVDEALQALKTSTGRTGYGLLPVFDADELLGEMRVIKGELDLQNQRKACDISAESHREVMKYVKPGRTEKDIHGYFIHQFMARGAAREGYSGIVARGPNATTLHYIFNDETTKPGEIILLDCGAEYNYFTADITRAYPVSGKFTDEQAEVYSAVLNVQKTIIDFVKPGVKFQELHEMGTSLLTDAMLDLGLLSGRKDDIIQAQQQKKYYPHGIGHFLGMDVHDSGMYFSKTGEPRKIEENMVFTVEPGLYIPENDSNAPKGYQGIGVRIEDNIRVTANGAENMTIKAPKEIADLEKIIGTYN